MKITFTDGSAARFELDILFLQQLYALLTKVSAILTVSGYS